MMILYGLLRKRSLNASAPRSVPSASERPTVKLHFSVDGAGVGGGALDMMENRVAPPQAPLETNEPSPHEVV